MGQGWAARLFERNPYIAVAFAVAMASVFVGYDTWRLVIGPRTISEAQVLVGFTWGAVAGLVLVGAVVGVLFTHRGYLLQRWEIAGPAMLVWLPLFVWTHPRHGSEVLTSTFQVGAMIFTTITIATLMSGMARHWWRRAREQRH